MWLPKLFYLTEGCSRFLNSSTKRHCSTVQRTVIFIYVIVYSITTLSTRKNYLKYWFVSGYRRDILVSLVGGIVEFRSKAKLSKSSTIQNW